jgi:hypothetical protein
MGNNCSPEECTQIISLTVVSIAIDHVYQQDDCGFNELILVVAAHVVAEKQVCKVGPCILLLLFGPKCFIFYGQGTTV